MKDSKEKVTTNSNPFLQIKKAETLFGNYYYAERKGVDSVAFILRKIRVGGAPRLYTNDMHEYGLIKELKPPIGQRLLTAFGGSLDANMDPVATVVRELEEEAGYGPNGTIICPLGKVFVSTQMNQWCHLFLVDVQNAEWLERKPENKYEEDSTVQWLSDQEILMGPDWKSLVILERARRPYSYAKSSAA